MPLTIAAPEGSHFDFEEVKTAKGSQTLGEVPILVWDDFDACVAFYGKEAIADSLDGTSFRVSHQNIARRLKAAGKSDDEIATAQIAFRPGKRLGGSSTPVSRARKGAEAAAVASGAGDAIARFLERVAKGDTAAIAALGN